MNLKSFTGSLDSNHQSAIDQIQSEFTSANWIDGENRNAESGGTFETFDPASNDPIIDVPRSDDTDVNVAVEAARSAANGEWPTLSPEDRSRLLLEWIEAMRDHADELAFLNAIDVGKPIGNAQFDVQSALEFFEYTATVARAQQDTRIPHTPESLIYTRREPYGVVGQILPWNYPTLLAAWKITPALVTGNTVVVKSSENAPLSTARIAQLSEGILPDGVLNVIHGFGEEAGAPLADHQDIDKLSFTGSVETGSEVMSTAASHITPTTLELGGKSPFVVFPDADIDQAVEQASMGIFYNQGQSCDACSRVIVHESIADEFVDKFVEAANAYEPGDPLVEETTFGPLAFEDQFEKVSQYVELGQDEGATVATGGEPPQDPPHDNGWFFRPTVFVDVDNDMRIAQEEIFGPVQCVITFNDYDEAIEIANDVEFGLCAGVATKDPSIAHRAAADIEAGSVYVNQYYGTIPGMPFGGFKKSGIGRECAMQTLDEYLNVKAVNVALEEPNI